MQSVFTDILSFYPHTSNVRLPGQVQDTHLTDEKTEASGGFSHLVPSSVLHREVVLRPKAWLSASCPHGTLSQLLKHFHLETSMELTQVRCS